jgi:hypothetical protein
MRRPDFLKKAAAPGCGRRDGTGAPPPASRVLRIALARRPDPGDLWRAAGPAKRAAPGAAPVSSRRPPAPRGPAVGGLIPGTTMEGAWTTTASHRTQAYTCSIKQTAGKLQG